jgi:hypothetical protein
MRHAFRGALAALVSVLVLTPAAAQAPERWTGPDRSRTPKMMQPDVDFAMTELCFPWILGDPDPARGRTGVVARPGEDLPEDAGRSFFVGRGGVMVNLVSSDDARNCTVLVRDGDPAKLRAELGAAMARWPQAMTPGGYQYPPNAYASRELLCSPAAGPHDGLLVSVGKPGGKTPAMVVTLMRTDKRSERCDGVPPGEGARRLGL